MNIRSLTRGIEYRGTVEGKRQTYYVFEGQGVFLVFSFSRSKKNAGYFNVVDSAAVESVARRFGGERGVTAQDVAKRKSKGIPDALLALNVLYVLVALDRASIDTRREGPRLYFNVRRP
jgi:hypothetical protein